MPKGQHQHNNRNPVPVRAQHDDGNAAQDQAQLVNQNNHIVCPNVAELPTLDQQIRTHTQSQENIFYTISSRLDNIDASLIDLQNTQNEMQNTQNEILTSLRRIEESLGIDQGGEWSKSKEFAYKNLTELDPRQISTFFQKFIDQNNDLGISLTRNERRDKKLLLHKVDIYWDIIKPKLIEQFPTIIDEILHPRQ